MHNDDYRQRGYGQRRVGFGDRPAVVVVDFQLGFTDARYRLGGGPMVDAAVDATARLLGVARRHGAPVACCAMTWSRAADMPYWKVDALYGGEFFHDHPAAAIDPRVYAPDYDLKVTKSAPSIFFNTPVHSYFVKQRIDTVIVCGCITSGCVRASVIDSFSLGYRTLVPRDCVGDYEREAHESNLRDIDRRYADVLSSTEVIAYLDRLP